MGGHIIQRSHTERSTISPLGDSGHGDIHEPCGTGAFCGVGNALGDVAILAPHHLLVPVKPKEAAVFPVRRRPHVANTADGHIHAAERYGSSCEHIG